MARKAVRVSIMRTTYATYVLQKIYCGKETCTKCPHGPYWYAFILIRRINKEGVEIIRQVAKYIGKDFHLLPGDLGKAREGWKKREIYDFEAA